MGVMECSRAGCEEIMCRKYSRDHGYICRSCFDGLLKYCISIKSVDKTVIHNFMSIPLRRKVPAKSIDISELVEEALNEEFS